VAGAKIVTNAKSPGAKCYGFVMMASTEEASKCIQHLHRTELHGRMISVERVCDFRYAVYVIILQLSVLDISSVFLISDTTRVSLLHICKRVKRHTWGHSKIEKNVKVRSRTDCPSPVIDRI